MITRIGEECSSHMGLDARKPAQSVQHLCYSLYEVSYLNLLQAKLQFSGNTL